MREFLKKKSGMLHDILDMAESVLISATAVLLIFTFLFRIVAVNGGSMNNTLMNGDKLIITHLFYKPEVGDIVVFANDSPILVDKHLIKRVIALPGQTVDIDEASGNVLVNGKYIDEPYVNGLTYPLSPYDYPVTVPEGCIFVMGDNRFHDGKNHSTDSRDDLVGFVDIDTIVGKVIFRFLPFSELGKIG